MRKHAVGVIASWPQTRRYPIASALDNVKPEYDVIVIGSGLGGLTARGPKKFAALLSAATFTESGKGMKMTNILYGSIWTRLGLRNSDVLISVGGQATRTKSSIVRIRSALRKAKTLKIKINRDGSNTTLTATTATLEQIRAEFAL